MARLRPALLFLAAVCALVSSAASADDDLYAVGVGIGDITGPAADIAMMGYGKSDQYSSGIHTRQFARSFIVQSRNGADSPVVFITTDVGQVFQSVKMGVITRIAASPVLPKGLYTRDNVMISASHTHAGPGGYSWYALYSISNLGFCQESYDAYVNGIVTSLENAHRHLQRNVRVFVIEGTLKDANINRSPTAYLLNPEAERAQYPDGDTDKLMTLLRFETAEGKPVGMLNWFAVHANSMSNTNHLISADNKGYAQFLIEKQFNGADTMMGKGEFVASFGQSNEGDSSPQTKGAWCPDGVTPCSDDSTCGGKASACKGKGPGKDMFDSSRIIGEKQANKANELWANASETLQGEARAVHTNFNAAAGTIDAAYTTTGKQERSCRPAMGYSFAAGCTDGDGAFDFKQGDTSGNKFWNFVRSFLHKPSSDQKKCQGTKPILLDVGNMPALNWFPDVVPIQLIRLGQLVIVGVPGEFTTMAGRRVRAQIRKTLIENGENPDTLRVVIAGLANSYTSYITTPEEYEGQRYEGASTAYGPHTLPRYLQEFTGLAKHLALKTTPQPGPTAKDLTKDVIKGFILPVVIDTCPIFKSFGDVDQQPAKSYKVGQRVSVKFHSANPRSNRMSGGTFLEVQRNDGNKWVTIRTDGDVDTRYVWKRVGIADSSATVQWDIGREIKPGTYRIRHAATAKKITGLKKFQGTSNSFTVVA